MAAVHSDQTRREDNDTSNSARCRCMPSFAKAFRAWSNQGTGRGSRRKERHQQRQSESKACEDSGANGSSTIAKHDHGNKSMRPLESLSFELNAVTSLSLNFSWGSEESSLFITPTRPAGGEAASDIPSGSLAGGGPSKIISPISIRLAHPTMPGSSNIDDHEDITMSEMPKTCSLGMHIRKNSRGIRASRSRVISSAWAPECVGNLFVFQGDKVPILMEIFTSTSSPDYQDMTKWLSQSFAETGKNSNDPQFVPIVFHVTDLPKDTRNESSGTSLGHSEFTERRLAYENSWESESTHSDERYNGHGTCIVVNGECVQMDEVFKRHRAGMPVACRSRSPGVLKVLLASESTALITFQPLPQCRHMIGQLVANVALVGCSSHCTSLRHDASCTNTHHCTVLDLVQIQLEKRQGNAYHVAGLDVSSPETASFRMPGILSYGLVVWVTHGYVDSTPIAVGYCGLK